MIENVGTYVGLCPGPENLHPFALKATAAEISPMLTHIFQQSLSCGRLPAQWKHTYVTPVYKKKATELILETTAPYH